MLGGDLTVESQVNHHTTFILTLPAVDKYRTVLFASQIGRVIYMPAINIIQLKFDKPFTSPEYRQFMGSVLGIFSKYKVKGGFSDYSLSGYPSAQDQQWLSTEILPFASDLGLKKLGIVVHELPTGQPANGYALAMQAQLEKLGIKTHFFLSEEEAIKILGQES
jgi:hypothetical protein